MKLIQLKESIEKGTDLWEHYRFVNIVADSLRVWVSFFCYARPLPLFREVVEQDLTEAIFTGYLSR